MNEDRKKRIKGVVSWFSSEKGFGFIQYAETKDIFVYYADILSDGFKTLKKGQAVEFEIVDGERGQQAANVKIL
ncbi:MAG: cold shock domain-containing protein [Actinobacteria bacterium]|nr:cold shock domain-containing protein [Actinomycetota bacterium]